MSKLLYIKMESVRFHRISTPRKLGEIMVFYAGIGKFLYRGNQNEKNWTTHLAERLITLLDDIA